MANTKKPSGLTITRKGNKYTFKWKKGETYSDGQRLSWTYTTKGKKNSYVHHPQGTIKLSGGTTSKTVTINANKLVYVGFEVWGKANNKSWSAHSSEEFAVKPPKPPVVSASWDGATPNKTTFSYSAKDEDHQPYDHCVYQSILVPNCPDDYKVGTLWTNAAKTNLNGTSGTFQTGAESGLTGTNARIVRVKAVGPGGASEWRYAYHVYAQPNAPTDVQAVASLNQATGGIALEATWNIMKPKMQRPVDETAIQYVIGVPTSGYGLPTGASWNDLDTPVSTDLNIWQGIMYQSMDEDECLFIRVAAKHDNNTNASGYLIAYYGELEAPTIQSVVPNQGTHTIALTISNGCQNPDSKTAVLYRNPDTGYTGVLGVLAHGSTTLNMVVPEWSGSAGSVGVYTFTGESEARTVSGGVSVYSINAVQESDTVWSTTAKTAANIVATKKDDESVMVEFGSSWSEATGAEISWSDRSDAWTSTEQPSTYDVTNNQQAFWIVSGLEKGKTWFFRVRMFYGDGDEKIYGDYSEIISVDLSAPPEKPTLILSENIISKSGEITASWQYNSADGTKMSYAEIAEKSGDTYTVIASSDVSSIDLSAEDMGWTIGNQYDLAVRVYSESGRQSAWSDVETVTIAEPLTCTIAQDSLVYDDIEINPETVTGDPAHFDGGQDNVKEVTSASVALEPHQAGTPWQDSTLYKTPYLFRKVPSINHSINSRYTTLVGADVAVNQIIRDSLNYGSTYNATKSYNSTTNELTLTPIDYTKTGGAYLIQATIPNHVYVTVGDVYLDHDGRIGFGIEGTVPNVDLDGNKWHKIERIDKPAGTASFVAYYIHNVPWTSGSFKIRNVQFIDLTQMLGTAIADTAYTKEQATAGSGIAWLKANGFDFSKYRAYNAGSLESVNPSAIKTVGFNQWDEEWEVGAINYNTGATETDPSRIRSKNYIPVLSNTTYYIKQPNGAGRIAFYDANKNHISSDSKADATFTTPANAQYMKFCTSLAYGATYNHDICINLHWDGSRDGEYEPYIEHEYALGNVPLHGVFKEENGNIVAYGDTRDAGGTRTHNFGQVDLGTLSWVYNSTYSVFAPTDASFLPKERGGSGITPRYDNTGNIAIADMPDKSFQLVTTNDRIWIKDSAYTDPAAFKTAMNGVYLVYALATPTTDTVDAFTNPQVVDADGTEEFVTSNNVPVGNQTRYADVYEITGTDEVTVTVADDPDNPTTSDDYTTDLTQTVYEGTVDVVRGKLTDKMKNFTVGGSTIIGIKKAGTASALFNVVAPTNIAPHADAEAPNLIASDFATKSSAAIWADESPAISSSPEGDRIWLRVAGVTTEDQLRTYLASAPFQLVYEIATPIEIDLTPNEIEALLGDNYVWSEQGEVTVRIADAVESGYYLDELPLTVTVTGAGNEGDTTMKIVRAENYAMERPDGKDYNGYEGDLIVARNQAGEDQISIDLSDLVGRFDDGAKYRIIATTQDQFGQSAEATKDFVVRWSHQAVIATGTAVIDGDIAKITPTKPDGALDSDMVDIYRLSADSPVLIYEGAEFGVTYVDPYPTIGEMGGYRLVLRTKNGDYITENDIPSWTDYTAGLDTVFQYIDFDGNRLPLKYNVEIDESAEKIMEVTQYLGGATQGDSLEGYKGNGTVNGVIPYDLDPADYLLLRELKRYAGVCHVRTKTGSNYTAFVSVNDSAAYNSPGHVHNVGLTIQQFDNPVLDGMTLTDWQVS